MKRIKVSFANLKIEFVDRERAIEQIGEFGKRGTFPVYVIYGPEGCGKTALLKQAKAMLEEDGYFVVYAACKPGTAMATSTPIKVMNRI